MPHLQKEHVMRSEGSEIFCEECGKRWTLNTDGTLTAQSGKTEFSHIPDWFEWQRSEVRKQIENGTYSFKDEVEVYSLPACMRFNDLGKATLTHDNENGFVLEGFYNGAPYKIQRKPHEMYGVHIEYDYCYIKPFDCIDISTEKDSFYCYPTLQNVVTKLSLATEEIFKIQSEKIAAKRK